MTVFFDEIIETLNSFDWNNLEATYRQVAELLRQVNLNRDLLRAEFESVGLHELQRRIELSHETATHYKWYVYKEPERGYVIWLHEYKSAALRRMGYAEVPHNHRYWFSSLILAGGFQHYYYSPDRIEDGSSFITMPVLEETYRTAGDVYTVDPDRVHSIAQLEEPTLTLIIRSRGVRDHSESFDLQTSAITRYYPFSSRIANFKQITDLI